MRRRVKERKEKRGGKENEYHVIKLLSEIGELLLCLKMCPPLFIKITF